jgi:hypothetical protein
MTLTETLQLKESFLKFEDLRALGYCEKRWQQDGRPATRWEMVNFIERMLQELQQNGIGYPKVLLLRKKEIQRQTFTVKPPEERVGPREPQIPAGDPCEECQGRGFLVLCGGNGTLCLACLGRGRKTAGAAASEKATQEIKAKYGVHP